MPSRLARARAAATGRGARATLVALADQAIVSGASFLTTILVGRAGGEGELGVYALAMSIVLLVVAAQDSLVSVPQRPGDAPGAELA